MVFHIETKKLSEPFILIKMKQVIQTQVHKHFVFNLKLVKNVIILFVQGKKKRTMLRKNLWDTNCVQFFAHLWDTNHCF